MQLQFLLLLFFLLTHPATPLTFNFPTFSNGIKNISLDEQASIGGQFIQLTSGGGADDSNSKNLGRATYYKPFLLRESATGKLADFTTNFTFVIDSQGKSYYANGLAFFLAPSTYNRAKGQSRVSFGLPSPPYVAVEFDIYQNNLSNVKDPIGEHVGIDINSVISKITMPWDGRINDGKTNSARVDYDSRSKTLSVTFTTYESGSDIQVMRNLNYRVDLNEYLPNRVVAGFSASTGDNLQALHRVSSWSFNSTSLLDVEAPAKSGKGNVGVAVGIGISGCLIFVGGIVFILFILCKKRKTGEISDEDPMVSDLIDDEFEKGTGPRKFSYGELARATCDFLEEEKLGEGGFGGVYRGFIKDLNSYVAVKRMSRGSKQGLKEYAAEVRVISRLRHRNLVQLIGWCHEKKLLLVYEIMPNSSLDSHLFKGKSLLTWEVRYKIAQGLASGLLYLHQEWEQCVLHRDIKSSNVMLDSNFNAKLGDFGLARLVDHGKESKTTALAGTMGYMAPEYVITGKASKESDVYSFGIVALEIACGRKSIDSKFESSNQFNMVEWVWELYGEDKVIEAADPRLCGNFVKKQMECLMIVGLWCAHPDYIMRPSIQQAIQVLTFEVPLPILPSKMPIATYNFAPPQSFSMLPCDIVNSQGGETEVSSSSKQEESCTVNQVTITMLESR